MAPYESSRTGRPGNRRRRYQREIWAALGRIRRTARIRTRSALLPPRRCGTSNATFWCRRRGDIANQSRCVLARSVRCGRNPRQSPSILCRKLARPRSPNGAWCSNSSIPGFPVIGYAPPACHRARSPQIGLSCRLRHSVSARKKFFLNCATGTTHADSRRLERVCRAEAADKASAVGGFTARSPTHGGFGSARGLLIIWSAALATSNRRLLEEHRDQRRNASVVATLGRSCGVGPAGFEPATKGL